MDRTPDITRSLDDVRAEIDRIDETLHRLIVERTALAAEVWKAKDRSMAGLAAIRPAREAEMLRAFARQHSGDMPLRVLWRIWRELIVANIRAQSPVAVHAPRKNGRGAGIWDLARAHFGFETAFTAHASAREALAAAAAEGALAVLPTDEAGAWVDDLAGRTDIRIFAALPQIVDAPRAPRAFLAGDVEIEPSGADTTVAVFNGTWAVARPAAGGRLAYAAQAGPVTLVGLAGLAGLEPAADGFTALGAHADPLIHAG
jgi:chorismate mutase